MELNQAMKRLVVAFCVSAALGLAAQTTPKPTTHTTQSTAAHAASATDYKLPPGEKRIPRVAKPVLTGWRYQDIVIGKGPEGESGKLWHVNYKGWRAADGVVFDSSDDHKRPIIGKDGKPELGPDGKPKMGDPEPLEFPQGMGRLIPGFDWAVYGMRVGGKRRVFIPWQLGYGNRAMPDRPGHPGIPAKSDLIFDVELVNVTDMPVMPQRPMMPRPLPHPGAPGAPGTPGAPGQPAKPGTPPPAGQAAPAPPTGAPATAPPPSGTAPSSAPANPATPPQSKPTPPPPQ